MRANIWGNGAIDRHHRIHIARAGPHRLVPEPRRRHGLLRNRQQCVTWGFAAPAFLSEVAHAQGAASRNLVVLYLGGGNDSLNTVVPYGDAFYYSRRPTIAIPPGSVLQIGSDSADLDRLDLRCTAELRAVGVWKTSDG